LTKTSCFLKRARARMCVCVCEKEKIIRLHFLRDSIHERKKLKNEDDERKSERIK